MKFLSLDYIKQHSRIDFNCEDEVLTLYAESAEEVVLDYCKKSVEELQSEYGQIPARLFHAALMLVDLSYKERSPVSVQDNKVIPYTFDLLLKPFIVLADEN